MILVTRWPLVQPKSDSYIETQDADNNHFHIILEPPAVQQSFRCFILLNMK